MSARNQPPTLRSRHANTFGVPVTVLQLARITGRRAPRDDLPPTPGGLDAVLETDVSAGPTADPEQYLGKDIDEDRRLVRQLIHELLLHRPAHMPVSGST
jgi:hypothetical protein